METVKASHLGASGLESELWGSSATSRELELMFYANDEIGTVHADPPFLNTQLHVESEPRVGSYTRRKLIVTYTSALQILHRVLHELVDPKNTQSTLSPLSLSHFFSNPATPDATAAAVKCRKFTDAILYLPLLVDLRKTS